MIKSKQPCLLPFVHLHFMQDAFYNSAIRGMSLTLTSTGVEANQ